MGRLQLAGTDDLNLLIKRIKVPSEARFQAAHQLASALRNPRHAAFKENRRAAAELAAILDREIESGSLAEKLVNLRIFLCGVLAEFHVSEGLEVLLKAATIQRGVEEVHIRREAVRAVAIRAEYLANLDPPASLQHSELIDTMMELAEDDERLVREVTAVALSWIGTDPLLGKLVSMLDDADPNVRYNAANGLARHGDAQCIEVLEEMLDAEETVGVNSEKLEWARGFKRASIMINALRAARLLADKMPQADFESLMSAVERLEDSNVDRPIQVQAADTLTYLRKRTQPVK